MYGCLGHQLRPEVLILFVFFVFNSDSFPSLTSFFILLSPSLLYNVSSGELFLISLILSSYKHILWLMSKAIFLFLFPFFNYYDILDGT